jgi:polysaccharide chain length determinant protein (PEP-CTERM system associated)
MNNGVETMLGHARTAARMAGRHRWLALGAAAIAFAAWSVGVARVPERYEASARVYVDTQTVLKPLMAGMTYEPDIDQQVRMLARTLMSRTNVERLIADPALHLVARTPRERDDLVAHLTEQILITPTTSTNLFDITYRGASPASSRKVVEAVVDMFVHSGTTERKRDSQDAERFIDEQIHSYEVQLTDSENRLKDFKMRNFSVSGVPPQDYFARVSMLGDEIDRLRSDLGAAERSRDTYKRELDGQESTGMSATAAEPAVATDLELRLEAQRRTLDDLLRKDTEQHPDVVGTRRQIATLEAELEARRAAERRTGAGGAGANARLSATSPVYQRLRVAYADAQSQAAALASRLASAQERLAQTRTVASRGPEVEAQLAQLNRDYDVIRKNYDMMVARRESALLGAKLDQQSQMAEFRVIDPARVSYSPVFPGRLHLLLLGLLGSLAIGTLVALARDLVTPTIDDAATLHALVDRPVLGSVSLALTAPMRARRRTQALRFGAATFALLLAQSGWIAWMALKPNLG